MKNFTDQEQIAIFKNCHSATELLIAREVLEGVQTIGKAPLQVYNCFMDFFFIGDLI